MNPLTQIKNTQKVTKAEIDLGLTDKASWHDRFKHSAYVFVGGLPFELTEGDVLAVFAQYGEIVDVHLVRDKKTGEEMAVPKLAAAAACCRHSCRRLLHVPLSPAIIPLLLPPGCQRRAQGHV